MQGKYKAASKKNYPHPSNLYFKWLVKEDFDLNVKTVKNISSANLVTATRSPVAI